MRKVFGPWGLLPLALIPLIYWPALTNLFGRWLDEAEYSHGFLIPLVSAYIVWERWPTIRASVGRGSWLGVPLVLLSLLLLVLGEISALYFAVHYSLVVLLLGLVLALLGRGAARQMLAPILILGFAIPLPHFIEVMLTAQLQLWSSELGVMMIRAMGMPVLLSGNVIDLGAVQLEVVEACSGLRYLFPLMSLGFLLAYFYRAALWKRLLIFVATVPITIGMNSLRIGLTGYWVDRYGIEMAEGLIHDLEGWVIFAICLAVLLLLVAVLEWCTTRRSLMQVLAVDKEPTPIPASAAWRLSAPAVAVIASTLGTFALLMQVERRQDAVLPNTHLALFPGVLGPWSGERDTLAHRVLERLLVSDYLMMNFRRPDDPVPVNFYVAYYANQRKGQSPHSPRVCIPGGGWQISEFSRVEVLGEMVNRAIIVRDGQRLLVYYWFSERGVPVVDEYHKKWLLFRDFLLTGRSDGALIRVTTPIAHYADAAQADRRLEDFIAHARPTLSAYLPSADLVTEAQTLTLGQINP